MLIPWRSATSTIGDSVLSLTVSKLELADWKPFMQGMVKQGEVGAKLQLVSQQGGKQLSFNLDAGVENLSLALGTNELTQVGLTLRTRGQATDSKVFTLPEYSLQVSRKTQPLIIASGAATFDRPSGDADLQLNAKLMLPQLAETLPLPNLKLSAGGAELKTHVIRKQNAQTLTGNLALTDLAAQFSGSTLRALQTLREVYAGIYLAAPHADRGLPRSGQSPMSRIKPKNV